MANSAMTQKQRKAKLFWQARARLYAQVPFNLRLPIAVGSGKQLLDDPVFMDGINPQALRSAIHQYVNNELVLRKLVKGGVRYDLEGNPVEATESDLKYARQRLSEVKAKRLEMTSRRQGSKTMLA